jgi:pimeloyl-ACP methyl ester carboxylesterase
MVPKETKNWILIRGLARGIGHWASFQDRLKNAFPHDAIHSIDIEGNGLLYQKRTPLNIKHFIRNFKNQLKAQNFNFSIPTYGLSLSLGSMAMVEWARQEPHFFKKIILMNTSAANFSNVLSRLSPQAMILGLRLAGLNSLIDREVESLYLTTSLERDQIRRDFKHDLELIVHFSQKYPTQIINIFRQLIAAASYRFPQKSPTDILILNGSKDKFVSPQCSIDIAKKWNCEIRIHPEAGHDISFQFPDWVIEQMRE